MPRTPRLDFPGARHHVMNRTVRREAMFTQDADCALFMDAVAEVPSRFGARIHGYALMPNHFHLMMEVPHGNLSEVMRHISSVFTQAYNRAHGHDGPVFRGRFRNEVVTSDTYWMHLLAYLHLNPVKAHLARRPEDCIWTSHLAYIDRQQRPDWLTCGELLGLFGSEAECAGYIDDVRRRRRGTPEGFDPAKFWRTPNTVEAPPSPVSHLRTAEQALDDVSALLGIPRERVLDLHRGRSANLPAWLAVWWLRRATTLTQAEVASLLKVSRGRVSQLQNKLHHLAADDAKVRSLMDGLEAVLTRSA